MPAGNIFPIVPLGVAIEHRKEFIEIDDFETYKRCRVQLHAKGIVLRDVISGSEIKTKKQQVCRTSDFLVAEIDAKIGGFGIVPPDLDGAIVSSHYFLFDINEHVLDRQFLDYFVRTPAFRDQVSAQGSTNYAAIRPAHVLEYKIPLPPLSEQQRIVSRIEELAARIEEARGLRRQTVEEAEALIQAARRTFFADVTSKSWVPLSTYVHKIENGWSPTCENRPATEEEWGVLKVGAVSFGKYDATENKALPATLEPKPQYEVLCGDFLMSRANTKDLVGACTIVEETRNHLMLSDKIFRFVFKEDGLGRHYLSHVLKSPALRSQIESAATGTSPTMKNISKEKVLNLLLPRLSLEDQRSIVAYLDHLQAKVDSLKQLQAETATELDALLPSVLDRAFKGNL